MRCFHEQLTLARRLGRPVSIHCRRAWGSLLELFRNNRGIAEESVIHSYGGPVELIGELAGYGVSFSFSGSITRERNRRGRKAATAVPPERLLIETDSPDIQPVNHEGNNEPATLVRVAEALAGLRGKTVDAIAEVTFTNGDRLFSR